MIGFGTQSIRGKQILLLKIPLQGRSCVGAVASDDPLGRSCIDELSAGISPFRADVDDVIRIRDDIEIMFDDEDGIPFLH